MFLNSLIKFVVLKIVVVFSFQFDRYRDNPIFVCPTTISDTCLCFINVKFQVVLITPLNQVVNRLSEMGVIAVRYLSSQYVDIKINVYDTITHV